MFINCGTKEFTSKNSFLLKNTASQITVIFLVNLYRFTRILSIVAVHFIRTLSPISTLKLSQNELKLNVYELTRLDTQKLGNHRNDDVFFFLSRLIILFGETSLFFSPRTSI